MSPVAPNTAKAMSAHWDDRADRFEQAPSHLRLRDRWSAIFAEAIGAGSGQAAVDLGTGTGACALALAELGYGVTAIDGSAGMLDHARIQAKQRGLSIHFVQSDMDSLMLADGAADVVSMRNVLWTLEQPFAAIQLARRLLRRNGTLLLSDGLWRRGENDSEQQFGHRLPNFNGVGEDQACQWLAQAGFGSVRSWQHLFAEHPYGAVYDQDDPTDLIQFFVLTAKAG